MEKKTLGEAATQPHRIKYKRIGEIRIKVRSLLTALSFYIWSDYVSLFAHCLCIFKFRIINYPWGMQLSGKDWRAIKLLKILPHLVDTLLIASGLTIFFLVGYQLQSWLIMKIIMLVLYIFFSAKYFSRKATNQIMYFWYLLY